MLHGIVNGIDTEVWNPETDPHARRALLGPQAAGPRRQPRARSRRASASHADDSPLFVLVSRLTWQKGIDLLACDHRDDIVAPARKLAVLGTGEPGAREPPSARSPPSTPAASAPSSATTSRWRT